MREIVKAKPIPTLDGWLLCEFDNGEKRFVDIRPSIVGYIGRQTRQDIFQQVYVDHDAGTVSWLDDLHIDPDTIYNRCIQIREVKNLAEIAKSDENGVWLERA